MPSEHASAFEHETQSLSPAWRGAWRGDDGSSRVRRHSQIVG